MSGADIVLRTEVVEDNAGAVVHLHVGDPYGEVERIEFLVSRGGGTATVHPPDRSVAFLVYELDVLRDATLDTTVQPRVVLDDGTIVNADPVVLGPRTPAGAGGLRSMRVVSRWSRVRVSVVPASAAIWRCWMRRGGWPTADGTEHGTVLDEYMRYEAYRDSFEFETQAFELGSEWFAVVIGFDANGVTIGRLQSQTVMTYGDGAYALEVWAEPTDTIERMTLAALDDLDGYIGWLRDLNLEGFISEVGWPFIDGEHWNQIAEAWFTRADEAELHVAVWAVGEFWGPTYSLQPYVFADTPPTVKAQATVLEAHLTPVDERYRRGLNVAGAEFGTPNTQETSSFSNANPSTHGVEYIYNSSDVFDYLAARGHVLARIPFRWERVQPQLEQPLDATELSRLRANVHAAEAAGMDVVLDVHNYGAYYQYDASLDLGVRTTLGSPELPNAAFADLWERLALEFNSEPAVWGYGLMNEPVDLPTYGERTPPQMWEEAAVAAANAIRATASSKRIIVGGYFWSHIWSHQTEHGHAFVGNDAIYEAHTYWDSNKSGTYAERELEVVLEETHVRWSANLPMWDAANDADDSQLFMVSVYPLFSPQPIATVPLWHKGVAEPADQCDPVTEPSCVWKNFEYLVRVVDQRNGESFEYATSISGHYA